ncbi:MAG: sigma-70 family RNA polymerase sigma factor [Desulfuromonadaceae bacterium]
MAETGGKRSSALQFEAVHREFRPRIRRYLRHLAGETEADDLTQEVFIRVDGALDGFRGEAALSTWIYRIATNVARDHARRRGRWIETDPETVETLPDPAQEGADRAYIRQEMRACVRDLVEQLPENYRVVLLLADFEELANADIAEILGLTLETVKIRLHRARSSFREILRRRCYFYRNENNELSCDRKPKP